MIAGDCIECGAGLVIVNSSAHCVECMAAQSPVFERALAATHVANSFDRFDAFLESEDLTIEEKRILLSYIWTGCDGAFWRYRRRLLPILYRVGYIGDLPRPTSTLRLYRGVYSTRHARGLCWTTEIDTARYFVRPGGRGPCLGGFVYTAVVAPDAILGGFDDRDESEYIVDPAKLPRLRRMEIVPADPDLS